MSSFEQPQLDNAELKPAAQAYHEVECRKKEFFFSTSATRQRIEEVGRLNQSEQLLPRSLHCCRFYDNNLFGLISHFYFSGNLSTSENKVVKKKTKVISTRVTERFANLIEQYCRQDAYINCSDLIRDAIREKLRNDAPERFKRLFEGENAA